MEQAISESRFEWGGAVMRAVVIMGNRRKRTDRRFCAADDVNPDRIAFPDSHGTRMMVVACASMRCVLYIVASNKKSNHQESTSNFKKHYLLMTYMSV